MPQQWAKLYDMLPGRQRVGAGWEPALPLILGAWHGTPAFFKILRLQEHLEWANRHGVLPEVAAFLGSLEESDWLHFGE
jgi:hypothetical protein